MLLPANTLLQNRYLILRQIGQGGMGAVYEAKDQRLGHRVALKQMLLSGELLERSFEREGRMLARLRHIALPKVSDYFTERNSHFLVMEYVEGDDLEKLLAKNGAFPLEQVLLWADQLLDALEYLHSQTPPVIHRDIKPANIKLSSQGHVVLLDFGLSKGGSISSRHMTTGKWSLYGYTPYYAPLEQIEGTGTDQRSDVYSLGTTLYHLLSGTQLPSTVTRARAQLDHNPDPLRPLHELNPQIPLSVSNILRVAMNLNPTQRPPNAKVMRQVLRKAAKDISGGITYPPTIAEQAPEPKQSPVPPVLPVPLAKPLPSVSQPTQESPKPGFSQGLGKPVPVPQAESKPNHVQQAPALPPVSPPVSPSTPKTQPKKWSSALVGVLFLMTFFCMVIAGAGVGFLRSNADGPTPTATMTSVATEIPPSVTPTAPTEPLVPENDGNSMPMGTPTEEAEVTQAPTEEADTDATDATETPSRASPEPNEPLDAPPTATAKVEAKPEVESTSTPTSLPEPTATVTVSPTVHQPRPVTKPSATATVYIEPSATATVYVQPTATPTVYVEPVEPTFTPTVYVEPTFTPTVYVEPTATPTVYVEPTFTPTVYVEPTFTPTVYVEPTFTPTVYVEPTFTPTVYVEPTFTPTPLPEVQPEPEPEPEPTLEIVAPYP